MPLLIAIDVVIDFLLHAMPYTCSLADISSSFSFSLLLMPYAIFITGRHIPGRTEHSRYATEQSE